jgi:hypothetical protein
VLGLRRDLLRVLEEAATTRSPSRHRRGRSTTSRRWCCAATPSRRRRDAHEGGPQAIAAFKTVRFEELLEIGAVTAARLARIVLDGTLGLQRVDHLVDDVADAFDVTERQARTLYDTALSIYSRQVDQLHTTGEPDELFYYAGPLDRRPGPFCRARVGKVFTRSNSKTPTTGSCRIRC